MRFKSQPLTNKKVPVTKGKVSGFLSWGSDNLYPQTLLDVIDDSDTAAAAMSVRAEFIEGNGLKDKLLYKMIVNRKGQTLDDLHMGVARNLAYGEVVCLHISYNALGQKVGIQSIPFEQVRFKEPDDLGNITQAGIFPYLGSNLYRKRKDEHKALFMYNPDPDIVLSQIIAAGGIEHYYGQLYYVVAGVSTDEIYHRPTYAGGDIAFETEAELAKSDYKLITTDMVSPGFIKGLAKKTSNKDSEEDTNSLKNTVEAHQGAENMGSVFVVEADTVDELNAITFESMAGNDLATRYANMFARTAERVCRRLRVPRELLSIKTDGIFNKDSVQLSSQLMQQTVNRYQRTASRCYDEAFRDWHTPLKNPDFSIENLNYFPNDNANGTVAQPE